MDCEAELPTIDASRHDTLVNTCAFVLVAASIVTANTATVLSNTLNKWLCMVFFFFSMSTF
jgi:hypothetical protein